jgi:hypothetical protein
METGREKAKRDRVERCEEDESDETTCQRIAEQQYRKIDKSSTHNQCK